MQAPDLPTIYLHAGTHKTGSTSIQVFLTANESMLASGGIFIPRTGRPIHQWGTDQAGHHNVGWELSGLGAFRPEDGTFERLLDEISASRAPVVVLTSEEFEYLHAKPDVLRAVADGFHGIGYATKVIVYLRAQAAYMQSTYVEGAKAGYVYGMDYARLMREIYDTGAYVPDPNIVIRFEYGPLLDAFAAVFGEENLIVKAYHAGLPPDALLREFLGLIGQRGLPAGNYTVPAPQNVSPSAIEVLAAMHRAIVRERDPGAPDLQQLVREFFPGQDTRVFARKFDVMPREEVGYYLARFAPDNLRIAERFGARVPFTTQADLPERDAASWAAVEAQRALLFTALKAWGISSGVS
jgi:hypothetical protein